MKITCCEIPFFLCSKIESSAKSSILLSAFLVIIYCTWILDRGFEITDEAYYLLMGMHAGSVKFYISAQQWVTTGLWQITGSLAKFRAMGMFLLITSSVLLGLGVFSACQNLGLVADHFKSKSVVIAGSIVSAMLYASTINLSPSYNLLASVGSYAAVGMTLLAVFSSNIKLKYVWYILASFAVAVEAICKPSAGVSTLALLLAWVILFEHFGFNKIYGALVMIFGMVVFTGILLFINTTIPEATQAVEQGMQLFRMVQVETVDARLIRYLIEYWSYILITLRSFTIPIVAMIFYVITRRHFFAKLSLVVLVITLIFDRHLLGGWNVNGSLNAPVAIFAMLVIALIISTPIWNKSRFVFALFMGLIFLPYSVAIGTGNALFTQVIDSLAPWGVLISLLGVANNNDEFNKMIILFVGFCFIVVVSLQIFTSSLRPYNLSSPLTKQDQTIVVGNLGKIKVDKGTYRFILDLNAAVKKCDIRPNAPFIGLYNIPGVALTLQAVPILTPWLNNEAQAKFVLDRVGPEDLHSAVIALQMRSNKMALPLPQELIAFPLGYRYCGTATYPYMQQEVQIWQSLVR